MSFSGSPKYRIDFLEWKTHVIDRYNWNPNLEFAIMNPDDQFNEDYAIAPESEIITVYHKNAIRLEQASPHLAYQYDVRSQVWDVTNDDIISSVVIDLNDYSI